jgi:hypothetical protein
MKSCQPRRCRSRLLSLYMYVVGEDLLENSPAVHVRRLGHDLPLAAGVVGLGKPLAHQRRPLSERSPRSGGTLVQRGLGVLGMLGSCGSFMTVESCLNTA